MKRVMDRAGRIILLSAVAALLVMSGCGDDKKGINWDDSDPINMVFALAEYNGDLIAAGAFGEWDNPTNQIKRQSGSTWQTIADVSSGFALDSGCYCLCVGDSGLYAAGEFTTVGGISANSIARWNGTNWQALGSGRPGLVATSLIKYSQYIAVAGFTPYAADDSVSEFAAWNEITSAWTTFGSPTITSYTDLALRAGALHAGGAGFVGGNWVNYVERWNGASWTQVASTIGSISGLGNAPLGGQASTNVLVVGGDFDTLGGQTLNGIGYTAGGAFYPLGTGLGSEYWHYVNAITTYNNDLIVAGYFQTAGGVPVTNIARWDGQWHAMGAGLRGEVRALIVHNGILIAGGEFEDADHDALGSIARWNGTSWSIEMLGT